MFKRFTCNENTAVPHLNDCALMQTHGGRLEFSLEKPNVIIGPNGAGKSALMTALSLATLSYYTGASALDNQYIHNREADGFWHEERYSLENPTFLPGLAFESDFGAATYFRPSHIPGNDHSVSAAMMCGYFDEARAYGRLTKAKSSGQAEQALLEKVRAVLRGATPAYSTTQWRYGEKEQEITYSLHNRSAIRKSNALIARYLSVPATAVPTVLMDEPEQSLDAMAQLGLWKEIEAVDAATVQIIVATHSLYPILHPERFHIIEAVPGYADAVRALV